MPFAPGTRLGPYEIHALLGTGGMGEVYSATDTRLGREVAIKVLPEDSARDAEWLARFEREAKIVAALNHPNIVTLYSIEDLAGTRFLTMERVEGETLERVLTQGALPLARILDMSLAMAEAIAAAHERGIVHRDLKPANVMVASNGWIKVLDFGLAKHVVRAANPGTPTSLTAAGAIVGTIPYMAPEQLQTGMVDERTDLFALGVVMYELASGARPFRGDSNVAVSSSILRDVPVPLTALRPELPRDLSRIVLRCLEKDPGHRFQTAGEILQELRQLKRDLERTALAIKIPVRQKAAMAADMPSIAVLPFVNTSNDQENDYFADGLSEELINVLARIRNLRVASRTSAFYFKGKDVDLATVAQKLNVATVLEGSVRKAGNRVRISAELIQVASDSHLWSQIYDRELADIFAVQEDIARSVVSELRAALLGEAPDAIGTASTRVEVESALQGRSANAEAYRLYLQGRFYATRYLDEDFARGIACYEQALRLDPDYALAWAGLASVYADLGSRGPMPPDEAYSQAVRNIERALQCAPDLPEAHQALARLRMEHTWDWKGSESAIRHALSLAPENAEIIEVAATLAAIQGRLPEAIQLSRQAAAMDPLSVPVNKSVWRHCWYAGLVTETEAAARKLLEINPHGGHVHYALAQAYLSANRLQEALAEFEQERSAVFRLVGISATHHALGEDTQATAALRKLIDQEGDTGACQVAWVYGFQGDADSAFSWLERAHRQRDTGLIFAKVHPFLRNLHADPRWQPFLEKMGLGGPDQAR